jgi:hypothetical protein
MAAKKTARKETTRKTRKPTVTVLPKGFTSIGGFGKSWPNDDTKVGQAIGGTVTDYDEIAVTREGRKVKVQNLKLETPEGEVFTVWESAGLMILFEEDYTGFQVWIRYDGLGAKKRGRNQARLYSVAYKE